MFETLVNNLPWPEKAATRSAAGPLYGAAETLCVAELAAKGLPLLVVTPNTTFRPTPTLFRID